MLLLRSHGTPRLGRLRLPLMPPFKCLFRCISRSTQDLVPAWPSLVQSLGPSSLAPLLLTFSRRVFTEKSFFLGMLNQQFLLRFIFRVVKTEIDSRKVHQPGMRKHRRGRAQRPAQLRGDPGELQIYWPSPQASRGGPESTQRDR